MASSASPLLKLELQASGENLNTWGTLANQVFAMIEDAIADLTTIALESTTPYTLSDTQYVANEARSAMLKFTGTLTTNIEVVCPTRTKAYLVSNETSGAYTVTLKTSGGTGIAVAQGSKALLYCDGTNVLTGIAGDVAGPASAGDNSLPLYDGTTGKLIKAGVALGTSGQVLQSQGAGQPPVFGSLATINQGKHTIGIPSAAMFPATTNGCAALAQAETSTHKINYKYLAFDANTVEYGWLVFPLPKSQNAGTVTFDIAWAHPSTTTNFNVAWNLAAVAFANDDALDTALGSAVQVNDTGGTTGDFYRTDESGAVTIGNTLSKGEWIFVRVARVATDATNDTLAVDAHLIGGVMYITIDAATDA
jgi:hypothetical protein